MGGTRPTYFIPPNFDNPLEGPVRLGQLIVDVHEPGRAIAPPESLPKHKVEVYKNEQRVFGQVQEQSERDELNLFALVANHVAAKLKLEVARQKLHRLVATVDRLEAQFIEPMVADPYVKASMMRDDVQEFLRTKWFRKRVFMITGLKIAYPSADLADKIVVTSETSNSQAAEVTVSGPGAKGGEKMARAVNAANQTSYVPALPFIYAYRLSVCRYGFRKKVTNAPNLKGALLAREDNPSPTMTKLDKTGPTPEELEFVFHGLGEEDIGLEELGSEAGSFSIIETLDDISNTPCEMLVSSGEQSAPLKQ